MHLRRSEKSPALLDHASLLLQPPEEASTEELLALDEVAGTREVDTSDRLEHLDTERLELQVLGLGPDALLEDLRLGVVRIAGVLSVDVRADTLDELLREVINSAC